MKDEVRLNMKSKLSIVREKNKLSKDYKLIMNFVSWCTESTSRVKSRLPAPDDYIFIIANYATIGTIHYTL
jgi:hypothetical protein